MKKLDYLQKTVISKQKQLDHYAANKHIYAAIDYVNVVVNVFMATYRQEYSLLKII